MEKSNLIAKLTEELESLRNETMLRNAAEGDRSMAHQCNDRFDCSWEEIRAQVFRDVDAMERWNTNIEYIAHHHGTTGNWMINKLMLLWMLRKRLRQVDKEVPPNYHGFGGRLDMERALSQLEDGSREPDQNTLFYVAPILVPDLAKEILASHGIEV
jgi:hypothetical protein